MNIPTVLIIFNRPHTTQKVFEVISQIKPPKLFLVADGPRTDIIGDDEKCQMARSIVELVNWDCEVFKNYSDVNLGCRDRVSSGLDWVFSHVNEAIILEDDCVPNLSFFKFCEELLEYYREDERIMMISGNNHKLAQHIDYSYYFSRYTHIWGWATWKRAWKHYDVKMNLWPIMKQSSWLKTILEDQKSIDYWSAIFQKTYEGSEQVWDYRWTFACWLQHGLTVIPSVNLVSNIGFGKDATHTKDTSRPNANLPTNDLHFPLEHPPVVVRNFEADYRTQHLLLQPPLSARLKRKLKKVLKVSPFS